MAKEKNAPKGNGGGKQNAIRFGDVARAIASSNAGRERKKREHHGRKVGREQTFANLVAQASTDERMLIEALDGEHQGELVALELEGEGTTTTKFTGTVIIQIDKLGEQPAAWVLASTYRPIKAHAEWRLPLKTLMMREYRSQNWNPQLRDWLTELATTLQVICAEPIAQRRAAIKHQGAKRQAGLAPAVRSQVTAPQLDRSAQPVAIAPTTTAPSAKKPKMQLLTWQHIEGAVGYWNHHAPFQDGWSAVGFAFLQQETIAGARKFVLVRATGKHPLHSTWEKAGCTEVVVDIADVFPKGPVTATNADDTPMRAARRELARYLKARYDELKALDPASSVMVPVAQLDYDPLELRGVYEQML